MRWFEGSIAAAIQEAKNKHVIFVVYISGDDEQSTQMTTTWEDNRVNQLVTRSGFVGLQVDVKSDACLQFSQIYPVVCVPCTFFIGENGVPLEVTGGHVKPEEFLVKIENAVQLHQKQLSGEPISTPSSAAATTSTAPTTTEPVPPGEVSSAAEQSAAAPSSEEEEVAGEGSSEQTQPLEERVERAQRLVEERQAERSQEAIEKTKKEEKERRELGHEMARLKQWKAEQEAREAREQIKKDKDEAKKARDRVRQQIAQDRADRAARFRQEQETDLQVKAESEKAKTAAKTEADAMEQAQRRETARLQFRLPDGSTITHQFPSSQTLDEARAFLREQVGTRYGMFTLSSTYPKINYTEEHMSRSLLDLDLAPSAALVVLPGRQGLRSLGSRGQSAGPVTTESSSFIWTILAPLIALWNFVYFLLFGGPQQPRGAYNAERESTRAQTTQPEASTSTQDTQTGSTQRSGQGARPKSSYGLRSRKDGNMHRLTANQDDDDEMALWNGNSTQQM